MIERDPASDAGFALMALTFPVWGLVCPATLILFVALLLRLPATVSITTALLIVFGLACCTALCAFLTAYFEDNQIRVSKHGLSFPLRYGLGLGFKLQRNWDDLYELKVKWNRKIDFDTSITMMFKSGGIVQLPVRYLALDELEQFFIAFEACASNCNRDAELDDFELTLQNKDHQAIQQSYTQLWEKSLSSRFSGATFTPLEPGAKLLEGRYQIIRQLAFGGFAALYVARNSKGENVVLKESVFGQDSKIQTKAEEFFRREAALLQRLDHPNIAKIYDYFLHDQRHYLVMEYIEGSDFNRLVLRDGRLPVEQVMQFALRMAETLAYLHEQSPPVVHRDVSPENVLLRSDGSLVLIDFGAAKELASSFTGTIIGKQAYISPEQFRGKASGKSDVYALGATMFYLLTAQLPEALSSSDPRKHRQDVPEHLNELVMACTEPEEEERLCSRQLLDRLQALSPPALAISSGGDV
jgi:hypothetical protein